MSTQYELKTLPLGEVLSQVKPPEKYVREKVDNELVEELRESIEKIGLKCPIIVDRDGIIIDGVHRYEALKKISRKDLQVPIIVLRDVSYSEEPERAIWLAYLVNRYRTGGADEQFNKQLLREAIYKITRYVINRLPESKRKVLISYLMSGKIPRELSTKISEIVGVSRQTVERWIKSVIDLLKQDFTNVSELVCGSSDGSPTHAVSHSESEHAAEMHEVKMPNIDPSKAEYIIRIREKVPDVDVERLNKLSKRMLQVLARKVESGQIDEVRRLLSEGEGNDSNSVNPVAGSATISTAGSKLGLNQHTNQSTGHDDGTNGTVRGPAEGSSNVEADANTKIEVEESQSNTTTVAAAVVEESREEPERESNEDSREENEK